MAHRIDDHWVWLGASLALVAIAHGIKYAIQDTIRLTEVEPIKDSNDDDQDQQPEDSISLATLKTLAESPNPSISNSAISLVISRFQRLPDNLLGLGADLRSRDPEVRRRARTARAFLQEWDPEIKLPGQNAGYYEADDLYMTGWDAIPRPRPNADEGEARRRRREAMVLHEGEGRIGEEDIIRPVRREAVV